MPSCLPSGTSWESVKATSWRLHAPHAIPHEVVHSVLKPVKDPVSHFVGDPPFINRFVKRRLLCGDDRVDESVHRLVALLRYLCERLSVRHQLPKLVHRKTQIFRLIKSAFPAVYIVVCTSSNSNEVSDLLDEGVIVGHVFKTATNDLIGQLEEVDSR